MEDCEIDGNRVTVDYARPKSEKQKKRGLAGPSSGTGTGAGGKDRRPLTYCGRK